MANDVPSWVLINVVGSKPEDWRICRDGWVNESQALVNNVYNQKMGIIGVYVSSDGRKREIIHSITPLNTGELP